MTFSTALTALASGAAIVGLVAFCAGALVLAAADLTGRDLVAASSDESRS